MFSVFREMIIWFFSLDLLILWIIADFLIMSHSHIPMINSTWSQCIFKNMLWIGCVSILFTVFAVVFICPEAFLIPARVWAAVLCHVVTRVQKRWKFLPWSNSQSSLETNKELELENSAGSAGPQARRAAREQRGGQSSFSTSLGVRLMVRRAASASSRRERQTNAQEGCARSVPSGEMQGCKLP